MWKRPFHSVFSMLVSPPAHPKMVMITCGFYCIIFVWWCNEKGGLYHQSILIDITGASKHVHERWGISSVFCAWRDPQKAPRRSKLFCFDWSTNIFNENGLLLLWKKEVDEKDVEEFAFQNMFLDHLSMQSFRCVIGDGLQVRFRCSWFVIWMWKRPFENMYTTLGGNHDALVVYVTVIKLNNVCTWIVCPKVQEASYLLLVFIQARDNKYKCWCKIVSTRWRNIVFICQSSP